MDVALTSMVLSQLNLQSQIDTAVLTMSLDTVEVASDNMIKMMEQSVTPNLGQTIDIKI